MERSLGQQEWLLCDGGVAPCSGATCIWRLLRFLCSFFFLDLGRVKITSRH